jgi:murein L,D-transpeptidase YafK
MFEKRKNKNHVFFIFALSFVAVLALAIAWKLGIVGLDLWKVYLSSQTIQRISGKMVNRRPEGLPKNLRNANKRLTDLIGGDIDKEKVALRISKSQYKLTVYYDGQPVKDYMTVYGGDPVNDKRREGDKCTPEGEFEVKDLYPHDRWSKFIWVSYPTDESWQKHNQAIADGKISKEVGIGGEIGIHGTPKGEDKLVTEGINWTAGCISVTRKDVDEIYSVLQTGTPITITH